MKAYYDRRAPEYDDWWRGSGLFVDRDRPAWNEEVEALCSAIASLDPARTLDLDQSETMLEVARRQAPSATFVRGDALSLPFDDGPFERVFTGHFYGHLEPEQRERFVAEARRLAPELVVVDSALREDVEPEEQQERVLNDGSRWEVYKRYFEPDALARELGSGRTLFAGRWFVAVRS